MKSVRLFALAMVSFGFLVLHSAVPLYADTLELATLLTQKLGVTEKQATGGAGALFNMAKKSLSEKDFGMVSNAVPGMDTLLKAAPKAGKLGGVEGVVSSLGSSASTLLGVASLVPQFSKLGLGEGMINKFVPVVLDYVNSKGSETATNLLKGIWE